MTPTDTIARSRPVGMPVKGEGARHVRTDGGTVDEARLDLGDARPRPG